MDDYRILVAQKVNNTIIMELISLIHCTIINGQESYLVHGEHYLAFENLGPGAHFSKVPVTFRARNQVFKSKYEEKECRSWLANYSILFR